MTVSNDGAAILKSLGIDNPAAKVLVDISRVQDAEVGDDGEAPVQAVVDGDEAEVLGEDVDAAGPARDGAVGSAVLLLLALGGHALVHGASAIAARLGIPPLVIGLTVVAWGTSAPELAVSLGAALRGQGDIALGNVVGSNIFNILSVLGISASVAPSDLAVAPAMLAFDIPVMVAVAVACLPVFFSGSTISRWEGVLFLALYVAYTLYLILYATGHDALQAYSTVMGAFVLPLLAVTLIILAVRHWRLAHPDHRT
jgi:cation:H+ antiporter